MAMRKGVFIVAAKRTAFGTYGGKLKSLTPTDLQEVACKAALQAGNVNPEIIDSVYIGSIMPSAPDTGYISRHAALRVGCKIDTPCLTINRLCGSGFQTIINGAQEIQLGESEVVMTGGSESMSGAPHAAYGTRWGVPLGANIQLEDVLWAGLTDLHIKTPMGITAENLAEKYNLSREQCDAYAVQSQNRWKAAQDGGRFKEEMAPITLKSKKGEQVFEVDEHPRPGVTVEQMAKLPAVFKKGGTVNPGNASGVCDGAGCVIVASEEAVKQHNLTPLARLIGYHTTGCDPKIMGIGPVPAIRSLLKKTEKSLDNIDLVEVNEAFAPQYLACEKELGLDPERTNVDGGAIALGHPLAASGSRITAHLVHELRRRGGKYAIGSACIGGGQGIALMLERM